MRLDERDFIKHIKMSLESFCVIFCMFFQPLQTNANNIIYIILWGKSYCMLPLGVSASLTNSVFIFRFFLFHEISVLMIGFVFAQIFRESSNTSGNGDSSITSHKNEVGKNLHYLTCSDKRLREIENWLEHFEISKSMNVKKRKFPLIILTSFFFPVAISLMAVNVKFLSNNYFMKEFHVKAIVIFDICIHALIIFLLG